MTNRATPPSAARLGAAVATLCVFAALLALMPALELWDRDEPLYGRTAQEILLSGNWILPQFNGSVFAHKTPLVYWLMALAQAVFGPTEFGARFVSAPAMAGSMWLTYLIGRRLFDAATGLRAMVMLGTALLSLYLGAAAMTDAVLLFTICLAIWIYLRLIAPGARRVLWLMAFAVALCLTLLAKGPVGPAVVIPVVLASWFTLPRGERPGAGVFAGGIVAGLAAFAGFLAWAIPANLQSGGSMLEQGVGIHMIGRALAPMEGHGAAGLGGWIATLPIYIPVIWLGFLPWTLALPGGLAALWRGTIGDRHGRAVLWAWIVPIFVIFSLVSTKLPHYIFPLFPALALACAAAWPALSRRARRIGAVLMALPYIAAAIALPWLALTGKPVPLAGALGFAALALSLTAYAAAGRRDGPPGIGPLAVAATALIAVLYWAVLPPVEAGLKLSKTIATELRDLPRGTRIYMSGYSEPSLVFYANRPFGEPIGMLGPREGPLSRYLAMPGETYIVADDRAADYLLANEGDRPFEEVTRAEAVNTNFGGRNQVVRLLRRPAER